MAGSFDLTVVSPPGDGITSLRFHGEDALLASSWDGTVRAWAVDADAGTSVATRVFETSAPVLDACFAEGGTAACSGGLAAAVSRHDLATGETAVIGAHDDAVKCVLWDEATRCVLSAGWDATLKCWDLRLPAETRCVRAETLPGKAYAASLHAAASPTTPSTPSTQQQRPNHDPNPDRLVVATSGRHVLVARPRDLLAGKGFERRLESPLARQTRCVACLPDGSGYVLTSAEGRVAWCPFEDGGQYNFKCHRAKEKDPNTNAGREGLEPSSSLVAETIHPVHAAAFHPRGAFATGGGDGLVNVWDGARRKRLHQYPAFETGVAALAFSASGGLLAAATSYGGEQGDADAPAPAIRTRRVGNDEVTFRGVGKK